MKAILVSGLCLFIAGCNAPSRDSQFMARADNAPPIQAFALGQPDAPVPSEAMLLLPVEAGGVLRVRERHFRNGTRQEIVLAGGTSGDNILEVSVRTSGGDDAPRGDLQIGKPSQRGVASETAGRFPGLAMHVVTRPMSNMFGPFGLAIGRRANGERCVFGWQWIDDIRGPASGSRSPLGSMLSGGMTPASVRLRMCRNNVTLDEMASYMEGLRPASAAAVERVVRLDRRAITPGGAVQASAASAGSGMVAPMGGSLESALPSAPVISSPPRPRAAAPAPARSTAPAPASSTARAAPPAPRPPQPRPVRTEPAPANTGMPSGPRYLAPVEGSMPDATSSVAPAASTFTSGRLDMSLPSRAYLGPSGQR